MVAFRVRISLAACDIKRLVPLPKFHIRGLQLLGQRNGQYAEWLRPYGLGNRVEDVKTVVHPGYIERREWLPAMQAVLATADDEPFSVCFADDVCLETGQVWNRSFFQYDFEIG